MTLNSKETKQKRNTKRAQFKHLKDTVLRYKERLCKDCNKYKSCRFLSSFTIHGEPEYRARCDNCHNKHNNEYRKDNRKRFNSYATVRKHKRKEQCIKYLGSKCMECGYEKSKRALTFHHKDRNKKKFTISQILDHSWSKLKVELEQCDLLCFNCHMEKEEKYDADIRKH